MRLVKGGTFLKHSNCQKRPKQISGSMRNKNVRRDKTATEAEGEEEEEEGEEAEEEVAFQVSDSQTSEETEEE